MTDHTNRSSEGMEKIKKILAYVFTVDFLLKILIITAIIVLLSLQNNGIRVQVDHMGSIQVSTPGYSSFEVKIKE
jgi:hypothetical protein